MIGTRYTLGEQSSLSIDWIVFFLYPALVSFFPTPLLFYSCARTGNNLHKSLSIVAKWGSVTAAPSARPSYGRLQFSAAVDAFSLCLLDGPLLRWALCSSYNRGTCAEWMMFHWFYVCMMEYEERRNRLPSWCTVRCILGFFMFGIFILLWINFKSLKRAFLLSQMQSHATHLHFKVIAAFQEQPYGFPSLTLEGFPALVQSRPCASHRPF